MEIEHPWENFLNARVRAILWMAQNGSSDLRISESLSMDEEQVFLIRKYALKERLEIDEKMESE